MDPGHSVNPLFRPGEGTPRRRVGPAGRRKGFKEGLGLNSFSIF